MIRPVVTCIVLFATSAAWADESPAPPGFTVLDARDPAQTKQKILSLSITSCDYAVQRLGEKKAPGRLDALRTDLAALAGDALGGKTLRVSRYDIFYNNQAILRGMVYPQFGGVIVEALKEHGVNCPIEKTHGGWFDPATLEHPHSPIIIELAATLDDKPLNVRIVHAPPEELPGNFKHPEEARELAAAMREAAAALATQIP